VVLPSTDGRDGEQAARTYDAALDQLKRESGLAA